MGMMTPQDLETRRAGVAPFTRTEHTDPRERLLMLYGVWVKCLPHQAGRRRLVERCIKNCKADIAARAASRTDCAWCGGSAGHPAFDLCSPEGES